MRASILKDKIDTQIAALEQRLQRLRALRDALDDEQMIEDVGLLDDSDTPKAENTPKRTYRSANMEKVTKFFNKRDNQQATIKEICRTTGISKSSIRQMLYRTHSGFFVRDSQQGGSRESLFRLATKNGENNNSQ